MELELGLKFTRAADEFTSEFKIAKDSLGPLFLTRETEAMFVLNALLKGYVRRNIKIEINEDGTLIAISGEKHVQETVLVGWKVYKKDTEIKGFKKVFKIPGGVTLDKIDATFNEDDSTLKVSMPKKVKGIQGTDIEEVEVKEELIKEESENLQVVDETTQRIETSRQEKEERAEPINADDDEKRDKEVDDLNNGRKVLEDKLLEKNLLNEQKVVEGPDMPKEEHGNQKPVDCIEESIEPKHDQEQQRNNDQGLEKENDNPTCEEEREGGSMVKSLEEGRDAESGRVEEEERRPEDKGFKICTPIVAGSALLLSFVVFVIQIMRSKNQNSRRRE
ncbi:hypothetical protein ACJIZ3_024699 [Penstemon smallii]|uniref:SHSP domain-containing protein n=1 Tax=Penstemon smallii TaxID=265156 RepID=A0ABD3TVW2_9LAMI